MKRGLSRTLKVAAVPAVLLAVLYGALQTAPGKSVIATALSRVLSRSEGVEVRVGRISGRIPGNVHIDRIEVSDDQGEWLAARNLHCRWVVRELLDGRVRLRKLGAEVIELHRFPASAKTTASQKKELKVSPLIAIQLDGLNVDQLKLGRRAVGIPLAYAVRSGGISLEQGRLSGGVAISGDAEGWVDLETSVTDLSGHQLKLSAELKKMNKPSFGLDRLSGSAEATIDASGVAAVIVARLEEKGRAGNLSTRLHYAAQKLQLQQFQLTNPKGSIRGDLTLGFSKSLIDVALNAGFVDSTTNHFTLRGTASVATSNKTWAVDVQDVEIRGWDTVVCSVSGMLNPLRVDLQGELKPFDIDQLPTGGLSGFNGQMSGRFSITGPLDDPQVDAGFEVLKFSSKKDALDELPGLDFLIVGGVAGGRLFASTSLTNFSRGFLSSEVAMPADFALSPFRFRLQPQETSGSLDADLDLDIFNGLAFMQNQFVDGKLTARLSREKQAMSGFVKVERGSYEHYGWGLLFRDFAAELEAIPKGFAIRKATATDGHAGSLELSGHLQAGAMDMQLDLTGAHVVQRPDIEATVSGRLKVAGKISRPAVSGHLVVDRADILPDNMVSPKPMLLTNYDARSSVDRAAGNRQRKPLPFGLDVRVEMPDQIYVNASLIDSVWGGALQVKDTPAGLSIQGKVTPRRGSVTFIGKKFRLEQGDILFTGRVPNMSVFNDLTAEYSRSDFTARLILNGEVNDPHFRVESTPALPEEEILSYILFDRDTSTISSYQAIQLAAAAGQLSGGLNGPGYIYAFRQSIGIDTLEWRESDEVGGSSSVAAGKYIASGLYVEVHTAPEDSETSGMTAEYELNRHISVETSAGPRMRPGIGVSWKNDY
jgi:autotransporter translocation and assembly factor TamB